LAGTRALLLIIGFLAVVLCAGCVKLGESSELPLAAVEATPTPVDRVNCGEILGTAFRSDNERQWFMDNCSKWPLVKVPDEASAPAAATVNEPPECAQIRGKPYESTQQRTWYLQNCNQNQPGGQQPATNSQAQSQQLSQTQTTSGPDRTDCNAIRGTAYRSNNERTWYQQHCGTSVQSAPLVTTGPDRTDCNAIRGTAYRSPAEQSWYNANCRN
jgi:hypothetical protein